MIAALHPRNLKRNHLIAQQRYQPADRPDEARSVLRRSNTSSWATGSPGSRPAATPPASRASPVPATFFDQLEVVAFAVPCAARPPSAPCFFAKPRRAFAPADYRRPLTICFRIRRPLRQPSARTTSRRGVASTGSFAPSAFHPAAPGNPLNCSSARGIIQCGISSRPDLQQKIAAHAAAPSALC